MTQSPTPPAPNTATELPARTLAELSTAPQPVITAPPMIEVTSVATPSSSFTTNCWSAIVVSAQVNTPVATGAPKLIASPRNVTGAGCGGASPPAAARVTQVSITVSPSLT